MIDFSSYSDIGGRPHNEDAIRVEKLPDGTVFAVLADGLGGHGGGDIASQTAVQVMTDGFCDKIRAGETVSKEILSDLVQQADAAVRSQQTKTTAMKTTIVSLALQKEQAVYAYAGDSRLYHFIEKEQGEWVIDFQTRDHSASYLAVILGQIEEKDIRFHEDRSRIFRALGQEDPVTADTGVLTLERPHHAFLLCSDGFWEYVWEEEMLHTLAEAKSAEDWLQSMRGILVSRVTGNYDNNSAISIMI